MIHIKVIDWKGNVYRVKVMAIPVVGEDLQVGFGSVDDKRVRGIVKNVERTIGKGIDDIRVYIADDNDELNYLSTFEEVDWW